MRAKKFPALALALVSLVAVGGAIAPGAAAQTPQPQATPPFMPGDDGVQNGTPVIRTRDGGSPTRLESIAVPPKSGAPFTLTLETEWVRPMSDGGSQTIANKRKIARDSSGRVYQERWLLVPKYGARRSQMNAIQIYDPHEHVVYTCMTLVEPHVCNMNNYYGSTDAIYKPASVQSGALPNDIGIAFHEDLGTKFVADQITTGARDTITYNAGVMGNDRSMTVIDEHWYSDDLAVNLLSIREDPRFGKQTFAVTKVNMSEPDPRLFELPAGYRVVDRRPPADAPDAVTPNAQ